MTICIIPARGNSKRIKNKNIINFFGKPIIAYVIDIAKRSKLFSRIIVTTDSKKVANISKKYGAEFIFRGKNLSNDYATSTAAVIDCIKKISSEKEKYHCCIYPTAVLTRPNDLKNSFKKIKRLKADHLIPITDYEYPPLRSLKKIGKNWVNFNEKRYLSKRSQDVPKLYHDTGSYYFYKTSSLLKKGEKLSKKTTYIYLNRFNSVDINYPSDLKIAKIKFKLLKKNG
tara:strand:- start:793 stop:1476 length:684 start_codon:yes stop_codon:yes gene_type:complete